MAYTLSTALALGAGQTGLTLSAQLMDTTGANVGGAVTSGFIEIGGGNYLWTYASFPDAFRGGVKFSAASVLKAFVGINPEEAERVDAAITSRAPAGASITTRAPVASGGAVSIVQGDDYATADGRALEWVNAAGSWPDLTGATIKFSVGSLTVTGSVVTPSGANQKVRVELTAVQTGALALGTFRYDVEATLSTGRKVTLVIDACTVQAQVTA